MGEREGRRSRNLKATSDGEAMCSRYAGEETCDARVGGLSCVATGRTSVDGEAGQERSAPPEGHLMVGRGGREGLEIRYTTISSRA